MNNILAILGIFFGVFAVALTGMLIVYVAFSFGGKKKADNQYILYLEITRQAILELTIRGKEYDGPRKLYRMNFPWVGDLNDVTNECLDVCREIDTIESKNAENTTHKADAAGEAAAA